MIRLAEVVLPEPQLVALAGFQASVNGAGDYAARVAEAKRLFPLRNTRTNSTFRIVKQHLTRMCSGVRRCVYCEDSLADEVEHIKPKDLYPEDVFRWPNYVYACGPCNGPKNSKFAVLEQGTGTLVRVTRKPRAPVTPPTAGEAALINPREDDPHEFLQLDLRDTFTFVPRSGLDERLRRKAEYTIELLFAGRETCPLLTRRPTETTWHTFAPTRSVAWPAPT
jgi:5-methylcytosine-specific restriction endonuclease McrA